VVCEGRRVHCGMRGKESALWRARSVEIYLITVQLKFMNGLLHYDVRLTDV